MSLRRFLPSVLIAGLLALITSCAQAADHPFGTPDQPVIVPPDVEGLVVTLVTVETLPVKIFKVGHVGEPGQPARKELLDIFTIFQTQYAAAPDGKIIPVASWKDEGLTQISCTLQQEPQNGFYLLGPDAIHCILLKAPVPSVWAIGDKLDLLACKTGVQSWTTADGTERKSPVYEQLSLPLTAAQPAAPTREQFLAALRAGQTFTLVIQEKAPSDKHAKLIAQKLVW